MQINLLAGTLKITLLLTTALGTYGAASLIQVVFHRMFGHTPRIAKLHEVHVRGHHAQYARQLITDRWIQTEQHVTGYYAVPLIPLVCAAYCLLPGIYFITHVCSLAFAIWWHIYLHRQYHIRGVWWERFRWFQEKRRLHLLHHQKPQKNFAIVEFSWDLVFGTYEEGEPENFSPKEAREHCHPAVRGEGNRSGRRRCVVSGTAVSNRSTRSRLRASSIARRVPPPR